MWASLLRGLINYLAVSIPLDFLDDNTLRRAQIACVTAMPPDVFYPTNAFGRVARRPKVGDYLRLNSPKRHRWHHLVVSAQHSGSRKIPMSKTHLIQMFAQYALMATL